MGSGQLILSQVEEEEEEHVGGPREGSGGCMWGTDNRGLVRVGRMLEARGPRSESLNMLWGAFPLNVDLRSY